MFWKKKKMFFWQHNVDAMLLRADISMSQGETVSAMADLEAAIVAAPVKTSFFLIIFGILFGQQ